MLGFLTCFATIIPMVGTALVWFPVAAYLAISGDWFNAIGLLAMELSSYRNRTTLSGSSFKEDGGYIRLSLFSSSHRPADIRVYGSHLRSVAAFIILSFVDMFKKEYLDLRNNLPSR